jgi:hypothetical protein
LTVGTDADICSGDIRPVITRAQARAVLHRDGGTGTTGFTVGVDAQA